jgi:hypothetical protein
MRDPAAHSARTAATTAGRPAGFRRPRVRALVASARDRWRALHCLASDLALARRLVALLRPALFGRQVGTWARSGGVGAPSPLAGWMPVPWP